MIENIRCKFLFRNPQSEIRNFYICPESTAESLIPFRSQIVDIPLSLPVAIETYLAPESTLSPYFGGMQNQLIRLPDLEPGVYPGLILHFDRLSVLSMSKEAALFTLIYKSGFGRRRDQESPCALILIYRAVLVFFCPLDQSIGEPFNLMNVIKADLMKFFRGDFVVEVNHPIPVACHFSH